MLKLHSLYKGIESFVEQVSIEQKNLNDLSQLLSQLFSENSRLSQEWKIFPAILVNTIAPFLVESPSHKGILPKRPDVFTICSADGSQIYPSKQLNFCVLNISQICFQIGTEERAMLETHSILYNKNDFYKAFYKNSPPKYDDNQSTENSSILITNDQVNALRQVKELEELLLLATRKRIHSRDILAIADGTLICWALKNNETLKQEYIHQIEQFRVHQIPVIAYKSSPESRSVAKVLEKLASEEFNDFKIQPELLTDALIFKTWLQAGERSAVFESRSDIVKEEYLESDKIYFFYLHTGSEIARVEFPAWVYDSGKVDFIHSVMMDDLQKGKGYPMTLTEAHEHAVIKKSEESQFFELLEKKCLEKGFTITDSAKVASKRTAVI